MKENVASRYETNGESVKIVYWYELEDNGKLIARCYKVTRSNEHGNRVWVFADGNSKENKIAAYALYWQIEEELEAA